MPSGTPVAAASATAMEQEQVIGERWWSAEELRRSAERFEPPEIAELVEAVGAGRLTAGPGVADGSAGA